MFKALKRLFSKQTPDTVLVDRSKLSPEARQLFDEITKTSNAGVVGDGKAEFLGVGTQEEFEDQERKDKFGVDKLFQE